MEIFPNVSHVLWKCCEMFQPPYRSNPTGGPGLKMNDPLFGALHFSFHKQLDFQFQPGVANDFFQNEAENCL